MNHIEIFGNLAADPEERYTASGQKIVTLRIADNQKKKGAEETIWWRCTIWGDRFDRMLPYLKKGSALIVMGEIKKPEIYTNREGNPQVSLDMTVCEIRFSPFGRPKEEEGASTQSGMSGIATESGFGGASDTSQIMSGTATSQPISQDDVPF